YAGATFKGQTLDGGVRRAGLRGLCDEANIQIQEEATPEDQLRVLIAAWRTRWVKERSSDDDDRRPQRIVRYWLDAIERIDWDAIGKAAVGSNLGRPAD